MRLPARSAFPGGFALRLPDRPKDLTVEGRLLSLARDPAAKTMLGSDGDALLWVGRRVDLLIETVTNPHDPSGEWPDGAHAQIYTSSDEALPYVELELLSPLRDLRIGERASLRVRYTLEARAERRPDRRGEAGARPLNRPRLARARTRAGRAALAAPPAGGGGGPVLAGRDAGFCGTASPT